MWTNKEMRDMIIIYGECRCDAKKAAQLYRERHPNLENYPGEYYFGVLDQRLKENGSFHDTRKRKGKSRICV